MCEKFLDKLGKYCSLNRSGKYGKRRGRLILAVHAINAIIWHIPFAFSFLQLPHSRCDKWWRSKFPKNYHLCTRRSNSSITQQRASRRMTRNYGSAQRAGIVPILGTQFYGPRTMEEGQTKANAQIDCCSCCKQRRGPHPHATGCSHTHKCGMKSPNPWEKLTFWFDRENKGAQPENHTRKSHTAGGKEEKREHVASQERSCNRSWSCVQQVASIGERASRIMIVLNKGINWLCNSLGISVSSI